MARRIEAGAAHDTGDLAAQERDLARAAVVGDGGEQADGQRDAEDVALPVEALDQDGVERHRAVDRGLPGALGHQECARLVQEGADLGGQDGGMAVLVEHGDLRVAQHAEPAALDQLQPGLAPVAADGGGVEAATQQGHVAVVDPGQEVGGFLGFLGIGSMGDVVAGGADALAHRGPVLHRGADVGQHPLDPLAQTGLGGRIRQRVDGAVHEGFVARAVLLFTGFQKLDDAALGVADDAGDRMDDQMDGDALPVQLRRDGIDQEGHVVVDDLHHRALGLPAMLVQPGRIDPHLGLAGRALLCPLPHRQCGAVKLFRGAAQQVIGGHVGVKALHEALRPRVRNPAAHQFGQLLPQVARQILRRRPHDGGCLLSGFSLVW